MRYNGTCMLQHFLHATGLTGLTSRLCGKVGRSRKDLFSYSAKAHTYNLLRDPGTTNKVE